MLKYLWTVTQDLLVAVTIVTLMHAVLERLYGRPGRIIHMAGIGLAIIASCVFAGFRNFTNRIIPSRWNHYIYAIIIVLTLVFMLLCLIPNRRRAERLGLHAKLHCLIGTGLSAVLVFYQLPGVLLYPFNFNTMGNGYLSSYYMVRMAGWLLALILLAAYSRVLWHCASHIAPLRLAIGLLCAAAFVFVLYCSGRFFVPWVNRAKWLHWQVPYSKEKYGWIGTWMMFTANQSMLFIWLILLIAVAIMALCLVQHIRVTEPWDNPAQHRKLRAHNRHFRRMAVTALTCAMLFTVFLTLVKSYDTRVIALSAPETYTVDDENIYVALDLVNDGHLHRFEYTTENGVDVRWIVVRKPNSASYGVGLDACDVCGNAGYYERNGQVICRRCDVVMNINTIGFKGGCNPIPLAYEMGDGNLIFKLADLIAGEREFK